MPMDDMEKKLFAKLDSVFPGERSNAVELLHEHQKKIHHFCRDIIFEVENEIDEHSKTKATLHAYSLANQGLWAMVWTKGKWRRHWRAVCTWGAIAAVAWVGFGWITGESKADRIAVNDGFSDLLTRTKFAVGRSGPTVYTVTVNGSPWWTIIVGRLESGSHTDAQAHDVTLQCLYLYATPATADARVYLKPNPYNPLGWLSWPERAKFCKPAA